MLTRCLIERGMPPDVATRKTTPRNSDNEILSSGRNSSSGSTSPGERCYASVRNGGEQEMQK